VAHCGADGAREGQGALTLLTLDGKELQPSQGAAKRSEVSSVEILLMHPSRLATLRAREREWGEQPSGPIKEHVSAASHQMGGDDN
jgi:hypothetical protein